MAVNTKSLDLESGSSQYAYAADDDAFSVVTTDKLSVEFWVKPESLHANNYAVCKGTTGQFEYGFIVGNATGQVTTAVWTTSGTPRYARDSATGTIVAGQWYHIAITIDDSGSYSLDNLKLYINGVNITGTTAGADSALGNGTAPFNIGLRTDASAYFDGLIDEVRVWNDVRTAEEIKANMFADVTGQANLQGYWKLNDDYTDSSTNGNDLTASGSPVFSSVTRFNTYRTVDPKIYSLDLENGSSQYAGIADGSQTGLDITSDLTIEGWVVAESLPMTLAGKWKLTDNNRSYLILISATDVKFYTSANGTAQNNTTHTMAFTTGQWYHIAVSYDASAGSSTLYVNGVLVGTETGLDTSLYNGSGSFQIGRYNEGASGTGDGLWSEVRVWDDIRTADEIKDNMFKKLTGTEANLQGYWKLENDYTDETANGNDLTASGSPVFSSTTPFPAYTAVRQSALSATDLASDANLQGYWKLEDTSDSSSNSNTLTLVNAPSYATGIFDNGLDLEAGSSQAAYAADSASLSITGSMSISAWINIESLPSSGGTYGIVTKFNATGNQRSYAFRLFNDGGTQKIQIIADQAGTSVTLDNGYWSNYLSVSTWVHVALVVVPSNASATTFLLYINGVSQGYATMTASGNINAIYDSTAPVYLGSSAGGGGSPFDGIIDDVAIFDRALSDQEVLDIYTGTATAGGNFFLMF